MTKLYKKYKQISSIPMTTMLIIQRIWRKTVKNSLKLKVVFI